LPVSLHPCNKLQCLADLPQIKSASYTLVSADAGSAISMTSTSATTVTVNSGLFAAGDTVFIQNLGTGNLTITAGSATVATAGSLILPQNDAGILYFVSTSSSVFYDFIQVGAASPLTTKGDLYTFSTSDTRLGVGANNTVLTADSAEATGLKWATPAGGGKVLQVVNATTTTAVNITTTTQTDTGLTATITPTLNTSKILVLVNQTVAVERSAGNNTGVKQTLLRGATVIGGTSTSRALSVGDIVGASGVYFTGIIPYSILDAPATTSATTYKTQGSVPAGPGADTVNFQPASIVSSIVLLEIGA